jgi:hypothetical protein
MGAARPWITKAIVSKKHNAGSIIVPDFKLYCRAIVPKPAQYRHKTKQID